MRNLTVEELDSVSGGVLDGYSGAGLVMGVLEFGALAATAPISAPVLGIAAGVAGGLVVAQMIADLS